ncbi:timeless protein-domain-containing protein [Gongronella butleri]|nr:timeless protein-domain-containing protein [Gongronella butleri]
MATEMEEKARREADMDKTRQLILSTCTALGGFEDRITSTGDVQKVYLVGDEALPCLKDLKRIIRVDEVWARQVLIDLNVLETDLIPIILTHKRLNTPIAERFVLACLEIIVPMTWPMPKLMAPDIHPDDQKTFRNMEASYRKMKHQLLEKGIFEAALKICVKALQIPFRERSTRDEAVIRLMIYFWRNLTAISDPLASTMASGEKIYESALQELLFTRLFESRVMELILTIASNTGTTDSTEWNTVLLEILFNLLEHTSAKAAYDATGEETPSSEMSGRLSAMLSSEKKVKKFSAEPAPSRHNRFGGSYMVQGWDGKKHVAMRQNAGYAKLDTIFSVQEKNLAGVKRKQLEETGAHPGYQGGRALLYLKQFSQSFMESCFNPFFSSLFKSMQREDKLILETDHHRYYFTKCWFLEFITYEIHAATVAYHEREEERRRKAKDTLILPSRQQPAQESLILPNRANNATSRTNANETQSPASSPQPGQASEDQEEDRLRFDYDLVANVIDLTVLGACMRRIRVCLDGKQWLDVQLTADCLRQMLIIVNGMANSATPEYREVADYIQSNLYHEQSTLDIFPDLFRTYKSQSFGYLEVVIKLNHVILKLLERFSKQHKVMFVRKKRRIRAKKNKAAAAHEDMADADQGMQQPDTVVIDSGDEDEEDERELNLAYREHIFAFETFEKRFVNYECVRVCCELLECYQTLKPESLHCITSLFHRLMVKRKAEHLFWKLPVLELFNRILQDKTRLAKSAALTNLYQFITFVTRQFFKKANLYPLLFVEVFFKVEPCKLPTQPAKSSLTSSAVDPIRIDDDE